LVDKTIVATGAHISNKPIHELCEKSGIDLYIGSLDDVLDRFYCAAKVLKPTYIVRLTADCPMLTGDIIDRVLQVYLTTDFDYVRNAVDGYDVEVFHYEALLTAAKLATEPAEREHVTKFFQTGEFDWLDCYIPDNIVGKYSVDTQEEFDRIRGVMEGCSQNQKGCLKGH
jgi:spore coat polysaccharide biosynthesis protein SpsF (cytidylyltransferase family)